MAAATVPSGPPPSTSAPRGIQRTSSVPVPSQTSPEISPVPSYLSMSRTRSRTRYRFESTQHSRMSSQDSNTRIRTNTAPQPPQSSNSTSSQSYRTLAHRRINRSDCIPTSPSRAIQASIKYVVCLPTHISFISWFSGLDEDVSMSTSRTRQFLTNCLP